VSATARSHALAFVPRRQNTLQGFAEVRLPSGMIIRDIGIYIDGARAWASPPSKPMLDKTASHCAMEEKSSIPM
jgi:hypothetical protein